jgi:hypothetical protein
VNPDRRYRGEGVALGTGVRPALVGDGTGAGMVALGTGAAVGTATGVRVPTLLVGTGLGTADGAAGPVGRGDDVGVRGVGVARAVALAAGVAPLAPAAVCPAPEVADEAAALAPCADGEVVFEEGWPVPAAAPPLHPVSASPAATPSAAPMVTRRFLLIERTCILPGVVRR